MQDIETDNLARLAIGGNAGIGLAAEEAVGLLLGQFLDLWECHSLTHHLVPDLHGRGHVCLLLMSVLALNAQSLTAHQWGTKLADDDGKDVLVALAFDKNGACELLVGAEHQMKEDGVPITITGSVSVPGTYTLNGKNLTMNLDKGKAEVDFDYEIKGMDAKTKAKMDKQIRGELNGMKGEFKKTMLDGMPKMHNMEIISLDSKELVLKIDNGREMPFYAL